MALCVIWNVPQNTIFCSFRMYQHTFHIISVYDNYNYTSVCFFSFEVWSCQILIFCCCKLVISWYTPFHQHQCTLEIVSTEEGTFNFWAQEVTEHRKPPNLPWVWRISRNILYTLQDYRVFSLLPPSLNNFPFHQDFQNK